jgi:hypothetical protein
MQQVTEGNEVLLSQFFQMRPFANFGLQSYYFKKNLHATTLQQEPSNQQLATTVEGVVILATERKGAYNFELDP